MNATFQNESRETPINEIESGSNAPHESVANSTGSVAGRPQPWLPYRNSIAIPSKQPAAAAIRKFQPKRFSVGLLCTTCGMAMILGVGFRAIETRQLGEDATMPVVALCVITGVMLVGGGFGIMATSSSGFDEAEFDRLATAGNISAVSSSKRDDIAHAEGNDHDDEADKFVVAG